LGPAGVPVVGGGTCQPTSARRAAFRTHQRPEKQLQFGEIAQELQRGSMNNILRQVEVQGVDAATQLGGCCGAEVEARRGQVQAVHIIPVCLPVRILSCYALL
jgi:hypothetical protein